MIIMNAKRTAFLARNNHDPHVKSYIFGQGHNCDIPDGALIDTFEYYDYAQYFRNALVRGTMLLPFANGAWSEDKIWLVSLNDAKFFVKWYNENKKTDAQLVLAD